MNNKVVLLVLVIVLLVSVCGLAQANHSLSSTSPQRIVSLTPNITENLFALGVGDNVVGVTTWCNYPPEATERVAVGDAFNLNLELLLSLEPDMVIGESGLVAGHIQQLESLGIEVISVEPTTVAETIDSIIYLGEVVGVPSNGEAIAAQMTDNLAELLATVPEDGGKSVFVEIWHEPLSTVGPGSLIDELINMAGGINIAADTGQAWPQFSEELVIARDPDVIILTGYNLAEVLDRAAWQGLTAVQGDELYEVNADIFARTTPRILDALEELITILN